jgi:hypothetical protein
MAARPTPSSALLLCVRLATNSRKRLETVVETAQRALLGARVTPREHAYYSSSIAVAEKMIAVFREIETLKVPKPPPQTPRKIGRPTREELAAAARRNGRKK